MSAFFNKKQLAEMKKFSKKIDKTKMKPGQFIDKMPVTCAEPEYSMTDKELDVAYSYKKCDIEPCDVNDFVKRLDGIIKKVEVVIDTPGNPKIMGVDWAQPTFTKNKLEGFEKLKTNVCSGCKEKFDYAEPVVGFKCWSCKSGY